MLICAWQTIYDGDIYEVKIFCGMDYPDKPPIVKFETQINLTVVNQETGLVGVASVNVIDVI